MAAENKTKKAKPRNEAQASSKRKKTQERHAKNRAENEARHQANLDAMRAQGIAPERVSVAKRENVQLTATQGFSAYVPVKLGGGNHSRSVRPSKLLRQARRQERA